MSNSDVANSMNDEAKKQSILEGQYIELLHLFREIYDRCGQGGVPTEESCGELLRKTKELLETSEFQELLSLLACRKKYADYQSSHGVNVALWNGIQARWNGMPEAELEALLYTGLFHDIGNSGISEEILEKPGELTAEEFELIHRHPMISCGLLESVGFFSEDILDGVRFHHEKMNGTGYPSGLMGIDIPMYARVTSVSDSFDAMMARRAYKNCVKTPLEVLAEFYKGKFEEMDLKLVDIFLDKICEKLIGAKVMLSNGHKGKILLLEKSKFESPFLEDLESHKLLDSSDGIKCVSIGHEPENDI